MAVDTVPRADFDSLLVGFLKRDSVALDRLPRLAGPYLTKLTNAWAPELPRDIRPEVISEIYRLLLEKPAESFDPSRGGAKTFLKLVLREAIRKVRATYCPPGRRTRRIDEGEKDGQVLPVLSLEDLNSEPYEPGSENRWVDKADAAHDTSILLERAPLHVAEAMRRIHLLGWTVAAAARHVGVSRFKLGREIAAFQESVSAVA